MLLWMLKKIKFENLMDEMKEAKGVKFDTELDADDLKELVKQFKDLYLKEKGKEFPSTLRFN